MYSTSNAGGWDWPTLKQQIDDAEGRDVYKTIPPEDAASLTGGVNRAVGIGFFFPSTTLFGLGEREDTLVLKRTTDSDPYEFWAFDSPHSPDNIAATYGSLPNIQGLDSSTSEELIWMNSSHSYTFIDDYTEESVDGSHVNFVSETGALEFFIFSSASSGTNNEMNRN